MGLFLLNVIQAVFTGLWSAFWISVAIVVSVVSSEIPFWFARHCWGPGLLWGARTKVALEPMPTLDPKATYVFVMNHQSMLDVPLAFALIPHNIRFVLKRSLLFVPFIGWYAWRTKMLFVDRGKPEQAYKSIQRGIARIRDGVSILAFPEGTRGEGPIRAFKRGPFVLAQGAGVAIVPIAIEGSARVLPRGTFAVRAGTVRVRFGAPIPTTGFSDSSKDLDRLRHSVRLELSSLHESIGGDGLPELQSQDMPVAETGEGEQPII